MAERVELRSRGHGGAGLGVSAGLIANVLCPGPSLAAYVYFPVADLTIGVNRAVRLHQCDYWAVTDHQTVTEVGAEKLGEPTIFTTRESAIKLKLPDGVRYEDVLTPPRSGTGAIGWSLFSATAAYALAYHLGARVIRVYGADMEGVNDYDATCNCRDRRTPERWSQEKGLVYQLREWFNANGAEFTWDSLTTS